MAAIIFSLVCLATLATPAYADNNDDFVNNLLTDLAPLITLFGEKVAMQFLSQSMGLADCVALAMAPIGVMTIIVSAIRVGGPAWLKAIIGRARENLSAAEIELMSSTSNEVCELWNGRHVVRCQGTADIWQCICLVPKDHSKASGPRQVVCMSLDQATSVDEKTQQEKGLLRRIEVSTYQKLKGRIRAWWKRAWDLKYLHRLSHYTRSRNDDCSSGSSGENLEAGGAPRSNFYNEWRLPTEPSTACSRGTVGVEAYLEALNALQRTDQPSRPTVPQTMGSLSTSERLESNQDKTHKTPGSVTVEEGQNQRQPGNSTDSEDIATGLTEDKSESGVLASSHNGYAESVSDMSATGVDIQWDPMTANSRQIVIVTSCGEDAPSISLNCHDDNSRTEVVLVALLGIVIQAAVLIFSGTATIEPKFASHFLKNGKPAQSYAFPLTLCGTVILTVGVLMCGMVVERSTEELYYAADNRRYDTYLVWLQKGSTVNDQEFRPFAIFPTKKRTYITWSMRKDRAERQRNEAKVKKLRVTLPTATAPQITNRPSTAPKFPSLGLETPATIGCCTALVGFAIQFMGLRGLSWIASLSQFIAIVIMTGLRAFVRRSLGTPPSFECLDAGFELDWFVRTFEKNVPQWMSDTEATAKSGTDDTPSSRQASFSSMQGRDRERATPTSQEHPAFTNVPINANAETILRIRRDLARLMKWHGPASQQAISLSEAMEVAASHLLNGPKENETKCAAPPGWFMDFMIDDQKWDIHMQLKTSRRGWRAGTDDLEALLSLWLSSIQLRQQAQHVEKGAERDGWLRNQRQRDTGFRLFGSSNLAFTLKRDLSLWIPRDVDIPEILEVQPVASSHMRRAISVPTHRIVGDKIEELIHATPNAGLKGLCSLRQRHYDNLIMSKAVGDRPVKISVEDSDLPGQYPSVFLTPTRKWTGGYCGIVSEDVPKRLFSRYMFCSFLRGITSKGLAWPESDLFKHRGGDGEWSSYGLLNPVLSRIIKDVSDTGFLSPSEAHFDVVATLSIANRLPDISFVLDQMQKEANDNLMHGGVVYMEELLLSVFGLAIQSRDSGDDVLVRGLAICQHYLGLLSLRSARRQREHGTKHEAEPDLESLQHTFKVILTLHCLPPLSALSSIFEGQLIPWNADNYALATRRAREMGEDEIKRFKLSASHLWAIGVPNHQLEKSGLDLDSRDAIGWTPAHYVASIRPGLEIDKLCLELGDSRFDTRCDDMFQLTPLHHACARANAGVVHALTKNEGQHSFVFTGISPMHFAAYSGDSDIVNMLIATVYSRVPRPVHAPKELHFREKDFDGRAPIHWAVMKGAIDIVKILKHDLNLKDQYNFSCLQLAVIYEHLALVKYLLDQPGTDMELLDNSGRNVLHHSLHGDGKILRVLVGRDKATVRRMTRVRDVYGHTPLLLAVTLRSDVKLIEMILHNMETEYMIAQTLNGQTALHLAVALGDTATAVAILALATEAAVYARQWVGNHTPPGLAQTLWEEVERGEVEDYEIRRRTEMWELMRQYGGH